MKLRLTILSAALVAVVLILRRFNPVEYQLFPSCLFHRLTGLSCPGCGMQRFVHALTHGRLAEAVGYNAFMPFVITYVLLFALERLVLNGTAQTRLREVVEGRTATTLLAVSVPIWFVVRNLLGL